MILGGPEQVKDHDCEARDNIVELKVQTARLGEKISHLSDTDIPGLMRKMDEMSRRTEQCFTGLEARLRTVEQTRPTWTDHSQLVTRVNELETESDTRKGKDTFITIAISMGVSIIVGLVSVFLYHVIGGKG